MNEDDRVIVCQREIRRLRSVVRACECERNMLIKYLQERMNREELSTDTKKTLKEVYTFIMQEVTE